MSLTDSRTICIVSSQVRDVYSGPGLYTKLLIEGLLNKGFHLIVISTANQTPDDYSGYLFYSVDPLIRFRGLTSWIPLGLIYDKEIKGITQFHKVDLIHFTDFREALFCSSKIPIIANVNDTYTMNLESMVYYKNHYYDWAERYLFYKVSHLLEKHFIKNVRLFIANSRFTLSSLVSSYLLSPSKVRLIYKSVNSKPYNRQKDIGIIKGADLSTPPTVLFVGTNMQRKGIITLIKAINDILIRVPQCNFLIVGEDRFLTTYKKIAANNNIIDKIKFLGHRSQTELFSIYNKASVFVLPSLTEAFGVAILEAMAAGAVPVASDVGGIPEIIQNEINGLLVPPDNPKALADAISRLLETPDLMAKLKSNGMETVDKFSPEVMINKTIDVYNDLLSNRR